MEVKQNTCQTSQHEIKGLNFSELASSITILSSSRLLNFMDTAELSRVHSRGVDGDHCPVQFHRLSRTCAKPTVLIEDTQDYRRAAW
jgi:hypothetical protein